MSAAHRDLPILEEYPGEDPADGAERTAEASAPFALKEQVAERLAAHRARRTQPLGASGVTPIAKAPPARARSARIAATVAERYANSQSYRAFLAAEAENAIRAAEAAQREAEAAAEIAAISAQAVADAQYELLAELDQWDSTASPEFIALADPAGAATLRIPGPAPALTVRIYDDPTRPVSQHPVSQHTVSQRAPGRPHTHGPLDEAESNALDEEIAFRQAPVFDEFAIAPGEIPANLIEFPRQLVAARRARPRLAEGPLREEAGQSSSTGTAQLRIFEVESALISNEPSGGPGDALEPEWTSILLAAHPVSATAASADHAIHPVFAPGSAPQTAPFRLRLTAAAVDGGIVAATFLGFAAAFTASADRFSAGLYAGQAFAPNASLATVQSAAIGTVVTLAVLALLYQILFFTFSDATPGMRYARIALCTFADENPTRRNMRRRIFAVLLAACPLGIGLLWAWLDEEGLGWHDRISRMYQRSY